MRIVTIDIGHNYTFMDDDHVAPLPLTHPVERVRDTVSDILTAAGFDGHTITHGTGYWRGEREPQTTARIYLTATPPASPTCWPAVEALRGAAAKIRDTLRQESVGFTVHEAQVEFV